MNVYKLTKNDDCAASVWLRDCKQAADICHQMGIPFFYEISLINPMTPLKVWTLEPGDARKPFCLSSRLWLDVAQEHDAVMN